MKVKICGTTSVADALMAEEAGADYVGGVVEVSFSERSIDWERARQIRQALRIPFVVLCFDRDVAWIVRLATFVKPAAIQLLGHEPPALVAQLRERVACEVWKSLFLPPVGEGRQVPDDLETTLRQQIAAYAAAGADKLLLDTADLTGGRFGGTGKASDWALAARLIRKSPVPTFLSGGLHAGNVREAITQVRPYGIDLCSGVESVKGRRDPAKLQALMEALADYRALGETCSP